MRATSLLRDHPVILLGLAVAGLVVWVAADAPPPPPDPAATTAPGAWALTPGAGPDALAPPPGRQSPDPGAVDLTLFDRLLPGMPRRDVEVLVGHPSPERVAAVGRERLTYRTTYPVAPPPPGDGPLAAVVALEYDASRPGHPLLRVHRPECF